jgi:hypothetical protein
MDTKKAGSAAGLLLILSLLLTLVVRVMPVQVQAAADPQPVTVNRVASTGVDVPISSAGDWAQATITIDDVPEGALVTGLNLKYKVSEGLHAANLDVQLTASGSRNAYALPADAGSETSEPEAQVRSISDIRAFNGRPVNGDWTLAVRQGNPDQEGYLDAFSISVDYATDMPMPQEEGDATGKPALFRLPSDHPQARPDDDDGAKSSAPQAPGVSSPQGWQVIAAEDFEGSFPNVWDVTGGWDDRSCPGRHTNGSWAGWNADLYASSCSDTYDDNRQDWMVYGPFDLSNASDAKVEFDMWREIEQTYDVVAFGVSSNGTDFNAVGWDGASPWAHYTVSFTDFVGDSSVWVAFIFISDASIHYEGAWVDQIEILKEVTGPTPIMCENFEGAFPNVWDVTGGWDDRSCTGRHTDGTWAAWNADLYASSCSDTYDNNRYDWMVYGPFDLSDCTTAWAEFDMWREIEQNYDRVAFGVSSNGTNFGSVSWTGDHPWAHYTVTFDDFCGDPSVWAAFIFESDGSVTYEGAWVDQLCLYKDGPNGAPAAPSNLSATCSGNAIDLSWTDNANDEDGFDIYRDGSYLATVGANTTNYTDNSIACDVNYCYEVEAFNASGASSPSNTDCATCPCTSCATVRIDPDPANISGTGTVCVDVDNVNDLGGFEFDLHYNPSCVHVDDIVLGPFPGGTGRTWSPVGPNINNGTGVATFGGFSFGSQPGDSGSGCMAEVTLNCQGSSNCNSVLDLQSVDLLDPASNPMCANVQDGQVNCSGCPWPPDFDGDGDVDVADIMHCASRWGCQCGDACYDPCCDFDDDCDIDVADIMQVAAQWGS